MGFIKPDGTGLGLSDLTEGQLLRKLGSSVLGVAQPLVALGTTRTNSTLALVDCTGLSFPVAADKDYWFRFTVIYQSAATTTGIALAVNGPASPKDVSAFIKIGTTTVAGGTVARSVRGYDATASSTSVDTANADCIAIVEGVLRTKTTSGTFILRFASSVAASQVSILAGSAVSFMEISPVAATVYTDGPNSVKLPRTIAQWETVNPLPGIPDHFSYFQEASGNVIDYGPGSIDLTPQVTPTYQTSVSGWTQKACTLVEANGGCSFRAVYGALDDPTTLNTADHVVWKLNATTGVRSFDILSSTGVGVGAAGLHQRFTAAGNIQIHRNGVTTTGSNNYEGDGVVHAHVFWVDHSLSQIRLVVWASSGSLETVTDTYTLDYADGANKGIGPASAAQFPPDGDILYYARWNNFPSGTVSGALLAAMGWP